MADSTKGLMPKLLPLTENQTQLEVENFWHNLLFQLSNHVRFVEFLTDNMVWKTKNKDPNRGLTATVNHTMEQRKTALEFMLGTVATYTPILSRSFVMEQATSIHDIWTRLRTYYGFNKTGGQVIDLANPVIKSGQSYESFWEQMYALFENALVKTDDKFMHGGELIGYNEKFTPTLLNLCVVTWLRGIHQDLPSQVKQQYTHQLGKTTIYSIREEISQNIPSLLHQVQASDTNLAVRRVLAERQQPRKFPTSRVCCLCQSANRKPTDHFFQKCPYLPANDRRFLQTLYRPSRVGLVEADLGEASRVEDPTDHLTPDVTSEELEPLIRRVNVEESPRLKVLYKENEVSIILDYGAEANLASKNSLVNLGIPIRQTVQRARQVDGATPLTVVGEASISFNYGHHALLFNCLVVEHLSVPFLAGVPFHSQNDIYARTSSRTVFIQNCCTYQYLTSTSHVEDNTAHDGKKKSYAKIMRVDCPVTILPGESVTCCIPSDFSKEDHVTVEPRLQAKSFRNTKHPWLEPTIAKVDSEGKISLCNSSTEPIKLSRHEQICNVRLTTSIDISNDHLPAPDSVTSENHTPRIPDPTSSGSAMQPDPSLGTSYSLLSSLDPDNLLSDSQRREFRRANQHYDDVFNPKIGLYNGASGPFKAVVNIGPTLPPQRKGRCPLYSNTDKQVLQQKFDELCDQGVFATPEALGVTVEYLNPSFLVKKMNDQGQVRGHRLVTSFGEVASYAKPQPSLLPRVDDTLQRIGQWSYLIKTDLSSAYFQIPLSAASLKFCGVCTPFKGIRAYTRCAMGMPGSETALEELMCRVLGPLIASGSVAKISDDLYCGASTPEELVKVWEQVLARLSDNGLRLSPSKTVICPLSTTVLGWIWNQGSLSASPHRVSALQVCDTPDTVFGLRSFLGTYKFLAKVIPSYCDTLHPLESMIAGKDTKEKLVWTEGQLEAFEAAKNHLGKRKTITMPREDDQLRIVTDASKIGIAATLYVVRKNKPLLAGFFNAKLRPHHGKWLPCELEALCIGEAIRHFRPYIIQSRHTTHVLTDSRPCVQAYSKLCRGEFSSSARVATFLTVLSDHGAKLEHISGEENSISDHASRNPISCENSTCHICKFVAQADTSVVRSVTVDDVTDVTSIDVFSSRNAWREVQKACPALTRLHAHLRQGTRPAGKARAPVVREVRRYLDRVVISTRDQLLVHKSDTGLRSEREKIVIPRAITPGIVTAIHLKLNHPSKLQLRRVLDRQFFALNMAETIEQVHSGCPTCASLREVPSRFKEYHTSEPEGMGRQYSADVIKRCGQCILFIRENVSAYSLACLIENERAVTLRDNLLSLLSNLRSSRGPQVTVRVDAASGFRALVNDGILHRHGVQVVIGNEKNANKNAIAERGIREVHAQLCRLQPTGGAVSTLTLSLAIENVNSELRSTGLSAREIWTQRSQFTHDQLPISDRIIIRERYQMRLKSHKASAKYAARGKTEEQTPEIDVGSLIYLLNDRDKTKARDRYLVVEMDSDAKECRIQKFVGRQLRSRQYTVRLSDCLAVQPTIIERRVVDNDETDENEMDFDDLQEPDDEDGNNPNRNGVENLVGNNGVENLVDNNGIENLVDDNGVENLVDNGPDLNLINNNADVVLYNNVNENIVVDNVGAGNVNNDEDEVLDIGRPQRAIRLHPKFQDYDMS